MGNQITTAAIHHLTLTVSDVRRSQDFYSKLLNFSHVTDFGDRAILSNGSVMLVLTPPPDPAQAISGDVFDENRIGLDHVSLNVGSVRDLHVAVALFDQHDVEHGEINNLQPFGIYVLAFRDPDNIQVELTAPHDS
ncbi:MAG: VOC family protein [Anaerolineae bacterium]|nr:VOC family protein [Anaerolineae bacterium]MCB0249787.1 VOC family protein [Anaerolineae bacterium]MCB9132543.1 VOC family protein [Anaerolineales bacterium]MCB9141656.1 VOC family protein [Anaerolineales bacterium]HRX01833.1 VOC family protein [Anaerolineae bacterium]